MTAWLKSKVRFPGRLREIWRSAHRTSCFCRSLRGEGCTQPGHATWPRWDAAKPQQHQGKVSAPCCAWPPWPCPGTELAGSPWLSLLWLHGPTLMPGVSTNTTPGSASLPFTELSTFNRWQSDCLEPTCSMDRLICTRKYLLEIVVNKHT